MTRLITGAALALALACAGIGSANAQSATVGGTAAGAAAGAVVGGPVGAVVGGAAGMAAGSTIDASRRGGTVIIEDDSMPTGSVVPGEVVVMDPRMEAAWQRCAKLYPSFNPNTGEFLGEDGLIHLCQ